jgi:hypothetical protein
MNIGSFSYKIKVEIPKDYTCRGCGAHGVKLWREYNTFANRTTLECCVCAGKSQKKDISKISAEGRIPDPDFPSVLSDQIGWMVPAVPTEEGNGFWGYTAVPEDGVNWWRALPNTQSNLNELVDAVHDLIADKQKLAKGLSNLHGDVDNVPYYKRR